MALIEKSPREERWGCAFGLLGSAVGMFLFPALAVRSVQLEPGESVCGTFAAGMGVVGLLLGALAGTLVGMILSHLVPSRDQSDDESESG